MPRTKPAYADYVNHMLRYYCRDPCGTEPTRPVDALNWKACERALNGLTPDEQAVIRALYRTDEYDMRYAVATYCALNGADETGTWRLVRNVCRDVAKERGLI